MRNETDRLEKYTRHIESKSWKIIGRKKSGWMIREDS